jgi:predicted glycosyltransferase
MLLAMLLRIPSMLIMDYEFVNLWTFHPNWLMVPDVITDGAVEARGRIMKYPGIKEDVYVPSFRPDPCIRAELGIRDDDFVVTLRPPANEAHYHNPASEALLEAVFRLLGSRQDIKVILLPRNQGQEESIRNLWEGLFSAGRIVVPARAVDGLNLIWHSELVISGGGTMNREAAALGVPVYSIFRGRIGAVDQYLAGLGRLVLLKSVEDVETKLILERRPRLAGPRIGNGETLKIIVENVISALESTCPMVL